MKHLATLALMLNLGAAGVYAQDKPVKMAFSGTEAASAINLQISDTHRFKHASGGMLTLTEKAVPVLADAAGNPVFLIATGQFTGTVSGVSGEEDHDEGQ